MSDRIIQARAPVRICDNGGWTDTWFSERGRIFNIAVWPGAEVQLSVRAEEHPGVILHAVDYRDRYQVDLESDGWGRHPLLEAAIRCVGLPEGTSLEVTVRSEVPAGASTGTSAAVTVALVGALAHLRGGPLSPREAADLAQRIETELLGRQCGIQDQLCCAFGGINLIEMNAYPQATVTSLAPEPEILWELDRRLLLILLGRGHDSSEVHQAVIRSLENAGPDSRKLEDLRCTAVLAAEALAGGDFAGLGQSMNQNTDAQARLHPELVSADARAVIDLARGGGALGWKVNGAGGEGGSITLLCGPEDDARRVLVERVESASALFRNLPIRLCPDGLRVWESNG